MKSWSHEYERYYPWVQISCSCTDCPDPPRACVGTHGPDQLPLFLCRKHLDQFEAATEGTAGGQYRSEIYEYQMSWRFFFDPRIRLDWLAVATIRTVSRLTGRDPKFRGRWYGPI